MATELPSRAVKPITPSEAATKSPSPKQQEAIDAAIDKINDWLIGVGPGSTYTLNLDAITGVPESIGLRDVIVKSYRDAGWNVRFDGRNWATFSVPCDPPPVPLDIVDKGLGFRKTEQVTPGAKTRGQEVAEVSVFMKSNGVDLWAGCQSAFIECEGFSGPDACESIRAWVAKLIDWERSAAVKEYRDSWVRAWNGASKFAAPGNPEALKSALKFEHELAAKEEREACAKVADEVGEEATASLRKATSAYTSFFHGAVGMAADVAIRIRKRGEVKP